MFSLLSIVFFNFFNRSTKKCECLTVYYQNLQFRLETHGNRTCELFSGQKTVYLDVAFQGYALKTQ